MKKMRFSLSQKRAITGLLFLSPWLIGFTWFYLRSLIMSVEFSLSNIHMDGNTVGYTLSWAGLSHYLFALTEHGSFRQVLTESMIDMVVDLPLIIFFSLFMAIILNQKFRGRTLARAIFFLPVILNSGAIQSALDMSRQLMAGGISSVSAQVTESSANGINVSYYLNLFGDLLIPPVVLEYIMGAIARINAIITASGVQIIIFIAALQSVPSALYEVAKIEGATAYETFWKITFPMVSPLIITNVVYTVVVSFSKSTILSLSYRTIFTEQNYALGTTMSLVSMVCVCSLLFVSCTWISKRTFYQN